MILPRTAPILVCLALIACGPEPVPQAPPGAVERTTEALKRDEAAELAATTDRNDREAEARAAAAARRIRKVERSGSKAR